VKGSEIPATGRGWLDCVESSHGTTDTCLICGRGLRTNDRESAVERVELDAGLRIPREAGVQLGRIQPGEQDGQDAALAGEPP